MSSEQDHTAYLRTARFDSLDGLRCLSIIPVFWHHCTLGPLPGVLGKGPLGVDFFFAISGFLITTLLLREVDEVGHVAAGAFYARRSLRIAPLYYGVLALYVVYASWLMALGPQRSHFLHNIPFFATYTSNWLVDYAVPHPVSFAFAWSLAAEEQFYLVWPWVIGARARIGWVVPVVVAGGLLVLSQGVAHGAWMPVLPPQGLARRVVGSIASPICMGALVAQLVHSRRGFAFASSWLGRRASAPLLFAFLVACTVLDGVPLWLAQLTMALLVAACAIRPDHWLRWPLSIRPMRWIGAVSYGIYLFHVAIITGARRLLPAAYAGPAFTFAITFPITVLLASASFVYFEQPILRLRARFRPRSEPFNRVASPACTRSSSAPSALPTFSPGTSSPTP